ncbi:hypothetical protein D0865_00477 [Hortaea werneckii]|uniref:DNA/RNA-binding domain-containing protein n=1 Tax=Hortaea werneckii TaxID=91943 RepID=A0A3M7DDF8_HORWE|nr:hypothetical protein D0865_00477 [Hortaea werneckii]
MEPLQLYSQFVTKTHAWTARLFKPTIAATEPKGEEVSKLGLHHSLPMQMVSPGSELSHEPDDPTSSKCSGEYEGVENTKHAVGPISQDQLAAEVRGIYAGLVKLEAKCIAYDAELDSQSHDKLTQGKEQALVEIHQTLLHEYYDFFMGTQHPSATKELKTLPARHRMFARMWRYAIQSLFEVLRHRRPDSHEYMLSFICLAYQMMALFLETVPNFEDIWVECLGDLARYRMAIEEDQDLRSHWAGVSSWWYIKATDKHPEVGRLYHHLGTLQYPNLQRFACYGKSQTCVTPFPSTKASMTSLCTPLAENENAASTAFRSAEASLCRMFALRYLQKSTVALEVAQTLALELLERPGGFCWKDNGVALAISSTSALLEHGSPTNPLRAAFDSAIQQHLRSTRPADVVRSTSSDEENDPQSPREPAQPANQPLLTNARDVTFAVLNSALRHGVVADILPCIHVMLCFVHSLIHIREHRYHHHYTVGKLFELQGVSWVQLSVFLNTLVHLVGGLPQEVLTCARQGSLYLAEESPGQYLLPEDFTMRGLVWAYFAYDSWFFDDPGDPNERFVESTTAGTHYISFDSTAARFKASGSDATI